MRNATPSALSSATVHAVLSGAATRFKLETTKPADVVAPWHGGKVPQSWSAAVALSEIDDLRSVFASILAAIA